MARDTASPARNFTLTTSERISALVAGPPAWSLRLRRIEDMHVEIVGALAEDDAKTVAIERKITLLNELVEKHNRYYPIEANLPFDQTGRLLERGKPWKRTPLFSFEGLLAEARDV
jgi:hypothetical protein